MASHMDEEWAAVSEEESSCYSSDGEEAKDHVTVKPADLDEDTFGMTVLVLARDSYFLERASKSENVYPRYFRLGLTVFLCLLTIVVQVTLLIEIKRFVCAREVHDIRLAYDLFEKTIYGAENCTKTPYGHHRGDLTKFNPSQAVKLSRLGTLKSKHKDDICRIPFSQPYFFGLVIIIWTFTCITEFRKTWNVCSNLLSLPTVDSMVNALKDSREVGTVDEECLVVVGLTLQLKASFVLIALIRFAITSFLLWVGCRWLLATRSFGDLLLNAVALEFILLLKEGFYMALMPTRSKLDVSMTKLLPHRPSLAPGLMEFGSSFIWLAVAIAWVLFYMLILQDVLPDYNWDVKYACTEYIKKRYEV